VRHNIHATGLVLGGAGLIIRGPSGSGKSILALDLLEHDHEAVLVSDDRIDLTVEDTGLVMHAAPNLAGLIELRGRGIVGRPHFERAPLHLVIDLVDELVRMPEADAFVTELFGVTLPRAPVPRSGVVDARHQRLLVIEALRGLNSPLGQA
jgi:serine kinase of HPr protein (carbohydrate metabolism regulator)